MSMTAGSGLANLHHIAGRGYQPKSMGIKMSRYFLPVAIAGAAFVGYQLWAKDKPQRAGFAAMRRRMMKRMMDAMPADSPPRLIVSILPRLQEQNDQILVLLKEQNDLLRQLGTKRN